MKTMHDFPLADYSPYEGSLKKRLNECTSNRILSFGNANVELEQYQNNITAKLVLTQKVDHESFTKVFHDGIFYLLKLSRTAQSVVMYIIQNLPKDRGYIVLDNATVMESCKFKNRKSIRDAIIELLEKNVLTRTTVPKKYWVNPLLMFNGNRITYAKEYILDDAECD